MQKEAFSINKIQPPFRLDLTAWALRRKPINEIDQWDGEFYSRALVLHDQPVLVHIAQAGDMWRPRLEVRAFTDKKIPKLKSQLVPTIEWMLGLNVDLREFYRLAREDKKLNLLSHSFLGLKPPRFPTVFEAIVNGIACQQLSLHVGLTLLNRLASMCGQHTYGSLIRSFPTAECLLKVTPRKFRELGFSRAKALAIKNLSNLHGQGNSTQNSLEKMNNAQAISQLKNLKGIGRWTAEYALLRGLGRIEIFPGDDVGAQNKLKRWLGLKRPLDYTRVGKILAKWNPYAGLIYFHLLLDELEKSGAFVLSRPSPKIVN